MTKIANITARTAGPKDLIRHGMKAFKRIAEVTNDYGPIAQSIHTLHGHHLLLIQRCDTQYHPINGALVVLFALMDDGLYMAYRSDKPDAATAFPISDAELLLICADAAERVPLSNRPKTKANRSTMAVQPDSDTYQSPEVKLREFQFMGLAEMADAQAHPEKYDFIPFGELLKRATKKN